MDPPSPSNIPLVGESRDWFESSADSHVAPTTGSTVQLTQQSPPRSHEGDESDHSTLAGHYATGQGYGGQDNDGYSLAAQDPEGMLPTVHHQRRSGPQQSFETGLSSSSNHNSGPSQPRSGHIPAAANQSTSADPFPYRSGVDGASDGDPPLQRPGLGVKRSSAVSAPQTQPATPWSDESNDLFRNSRSATTPSGDIPTKRPRVSGSSRSKASNFQAYRNSAGYLDGHLLSPTPNATTVSSTGSATSFVCPHCLKSCPNKSGLRKHEQTHDDNIKSRHKCPDCSKGFRYPREVRRHLDKVHAGNKVPCDNCDQLFSRRDNAARHRKVCRGGASGDSPFECERCGKQLSREQGQHAKDNVYEHECHGNVPISNERHRRPRSDRNVSVAPSSRSSSSSVKSVVTSTGEHAFFTTAPSANPQKHQTSSPGLTAATTLDDFDAATQGLPEDQQRECASAFVRSLREAVEIPPTRIAILATSKDRIADVFQTYAAMLVPHLDKQHYDAVKFVHRQRELISGLLHDPGYKSPAQSTTGAGEQPQKERFPEAETKLRIEAWLLSIVDCSDTTGLHNEVDHYAAEESGSYIRGAEVSLIEDSGAFLRSGLPWQWLTTRLSSLVRLSWPDGGLDDEISRKVMAMTTTANWAAGDVQTVLCCVDWDPAYFLLTQYDQNLLPRLREVVTLTGRDNQVQSMTCSEYIQQTWPIYGMSILYAVEDSINTFAAPAHRMLEDDLSIDIHLQGPQTIVQIKGQTPLLPQIVAQLAWLGAACRVSPDPDHNCFTTAHVETSHSSATAATFSIQYSHDMKPPTRASGCWFSFGYYASIADGFPITARYQGEEGLELGAELMATLAGATYATFFRDNFLLKGVASMLIPTQQMGQSTLWHFVHNSDGKFLPYTAADDFACNTRVNAEALNSNRHFVGWVSASELHFDKNLSAVRQPGRLKTGSGVTLEKASFSGGKFINAGLVFGLGNHLRPLWRDSTSSYANKIWQARQWPIILYDTDTQRAWLVDGASALLQITLGQIWSDKFVRLHQLESVPEVDLSWKSHKGGDEAMNILLNPKNQWLKLYQEASAPEVKRNWDEQGKFLGERPEQVLKVWGFRDQVQVNFELLTLMSVHQLEPTSGVKMRFKGSERLEGWSFKDVLDERTPLERKTVYLEPSGQGWEPFAREINALVLMGGGFGDVITPSPQVPTCCIWETVPQGQDLLVTTYNFLKEIAEEKRADDFPSHLTPTILWHQPDALFGGRCNTSGTSSAHPRDSVCSRIQVLLTSKLLEKLHAGSRGLVSSPKGKDAAESSSSAVIFGRPRRKWLPGKPFVMSSPSLPSEPNLAMPCHTRTTFETKNPLPVFTSLLPPDNSQSASSSEHPRLASSAGDSDTRISSQATSILPTGLSDDEPVFTRRHKRKAAAPASPTASSSDYTSAQTQDYSGHLHVTRKLSIRDKTRADLSSVGRSTTAGSGNDTSHETYKDTSGEPTLVVPRHSERLRTATRHQAVLEPTILDDTLPAKKRKISTTPGLRSSRRHLGDQRGLREAYDTQAD